MRWEMGRRSDNVEDRRGMGMGVPIVGGGIGTVVVLLLALFFGFDPSSILPSDPSAPPTSQT
jgi:predicted metalloprotease